MDIPSKVITVHNAGSLTTYDLRRELVRRNALDLPEDKINHKNMLERLMRDLVAEERKSADERAALLVAEETEKRETAKQLREQKKLDALERSKQRTSNPDYFKQKLGSNEEAKSRLDVVKDETAATGTSNQNEEDQPLTSTGEEDITDHSNSSQDDDPFRLYSNKSKNKIFVR